MKRSLVLCFLLAACSDGGTSGGSLATAADYQRAAVTALCAKYVRCGTISPSQEASCQSFYNAQVGDLMQAYSIDQAVAAARVAWNGSAARACVDFIAASGCDFKSLLGISGNPSCTSTARGLVPIGGSCLSEGECQNGYCDSGNAGGSSGCPGTCKAFTATGSDCSGTVRCAPTDSCDSSNLCTTRVARGGDCSDPSAICALGLVCSGNTCQPPGGAGAACAVGFILDTCADGLYCDDTSTPASPVCKRRLAAGAACSSKQQCGDGLVCADQGTGGVCAAPVDIGHSCAASPCAGDALCDPSQVCKLKGQTGDDCTNSGCSFANFCNTANQCAPKVSYGSACDPNESSPCGVGDCDATSKTCIHVCTP
jgi:hypothetical protein